MEVAVFRGSRARLRRYGPMEVRYFAVLSYERPGYFYSKHSNFMELQIFSFIE